MTEPLGNAKQALEPTNDSGRALPYLAWSLSGLAGLAGCVQGFIFGNELGGPLLGVMVAINAGAMAALLVSGLIDALARRLRRG